jgi:hypothetical protein
MKTLKITIEADLTEEYFQRKIDNLINEIKSGEASRKMIAGIETEMPRCDIKLEIIDNQQKQDS